jgi:hypothetical protein
MKAGNITNTHQMLKPKKFSHLLGFIGSFLFSKIIKVWFDLLNFIFFIFKIKNTKLVLIFYKNVIDLFMINI